MKFNIADHSIRPGEQMVEVFDNQGNLIAAIYGRGDHLMVASKYLASSEITHEAVPGVIIRLNRGDR